MRNAKPRLKELRDYIGRTGRTQSMLARVAGISEPTFSKVMNGTRHFTVVAAGRLADLTGIPVEKLLTDPDDSRLLKLLGKRMNSIGEIPSDKSRVT